MNKYYEAPEDEVFEDLKAKAIELWGTYDDTYKYATGKINRIKDIDNIQDNFMYIVAMFDSENMIRLSNLVSDETRKQVRSRLIAGGGNDMQF